ncbi:MAG TPA: hypothetical protein EYP46_03395 [Hadesarchaea archaeon]|nr:hypothetical protein [Hadesarchaea archaeon]
MNGAGIYGSELKIQGFSGYLCELLTLHYGSFQKLVKAASRWKPGTVIDPEHTYRDESEPNILFEGQPLIVIDPVDPNRNVAAAVSMENFAVFVRACQEFLSRPRREFFFSNKVELLDAKTLQKIIKQRGTKVLCVVFKSPDLVPDVLYPQLRKTQRTIMNRLAQAGFDVLRSDVWSDSDAGILLEFRVSKLPRVRKRIGPPITLDAGDFIREHLRSEKMLAGPYVDPTGRMVFELVQEETDAADALKRIMEKRTAFGKHVIEAVGKGYKIVDESGLLKLLRDRKFKEFISEYFTRRLPWYR